MAGSIGHGEQVPISRDALQLMHASILETDPRAGDEILDSSRDEHLAAVRVPRHAGADVDGDAADLSVHQLALPCVEPRPNLDSEVADCPVDCRCAADAARRPVEGCEEPVAGRIELMSTMACQLRSHERVMRFEQRTPSRIAKLGEVRCRVHDVGEEDGRENAILLAGRPLGIPAGGQELLDVVGDGTLTVGSVWRTSIPMFIRSSASSAPGLAP